MVKGLNFYRTMYDQVNIFSGDFQPVEQTANVDNAINVGAENEKREENTDVSNSENKIFFNINKSISQELAIVLIGILALQMAILISK